KERVPRMVNGRRWMSVVCVLALGVLGVARAGSGPRAMQIPAGANPAAMERGRPESADWMQRHGMVLEEIKQHPDTQLLMIGDSITNNYDKSEPPNQDFVPTWQKFYAPRKALNLGFSGDSTEHVLWRLNHGEVA